MTVQRRRRSTVVDAGHTPEHPPYWLIHALPWPTRIGAWQLARAAFVFAPSLAGHLPRAAKDVAYVADTYHQVHGDRVVFITDLVRFLAEEGTSWRERRTDWRAALDQLQYGRHAPPGLLLAIGRRAHSVISDTGQPHPDPPIPAWERVAIRKALAIQLALDWPLHIRHLTDTGHGLPALAPPSAPAAEPLDDPETWAHASIHHSEREPSPAGYRPSVAGVSRGVEPLLTRRPMPHPAADPADQPDILGPDWSRRAAVIPRPV